jgi:hypothetical protein
MVIPIHKYLADILEDAVSDIDHGVDENAIRNRVVRDINECTENRYAEGAIPFTAVADLLVGVWREQAAKYAFSQSLKKPGVWAEIMGRTLDDMRRKG